MLHSKSKAYISVRHSFLAQTLLSHSFMGRSVLVRIGFVRFRLWSWIWSCVSGFLLSLVLSSFLKLHSEKMASADVEFRCFVGGLAWSTNDISLQEAFSPYGEVVESKIISDRETGRPCGFSFMTFNDEQLMRDAINAMNGKMLDGRSITINPAQSRGNGGGGGGDGSRGYRKMPRYEVAS